MRSKIFYTILIVLLNFSSNKLYSQCSNYNISKISEIESTCSVLPLSMIHDANGLNYLYVANKEAGLRIYDISTPSNPVYIKNIPTSAMGNLEAMNLYQSGNYVYLALGNHFNTSQNAGIAIVDVSLPTNAVLKDYWEMPSTGGGSGIVKTEGNYAYLGAMKNGLIVLDISDKSDIKFVSQFVPDINYPTASPNPNLYNARGMEVKNNIVYLCYDAGGVRLINVNDKKYPKETGRFSNPDLNGKPRAYNNLVIDDTLLYVAVDYCGLEILNIRDTAKITIAGKWNPYNCPANNWFTSPVHANEIQFNKNCKSLFLSVGKTDMIVLDVSDVSNPDSCNYYGGASNNIGTWGLGLYQNQIYLSYVCSVIPFTSNWAGIKILSYTPCTNLLNEVDKENITIYPNPTTGKVFVNIPKSEFSKYSIKLYSVGGKIIKEFSITETTEIDTENIVKGIYYISTQKNGDKHFLIQKLVKL